MSLFSEVYPAQQAKELGLVTEVVPDAELMTTARAWAERLADGPGHRLSYISRHGAALNAARPFSLKGTAWIDLSPGWKRIVTRYAFPPESQHANRPRSSVSGNGQARRSTSSQASPRQAVIWQSIWGTTLAPGLRTIRASHHALNLSSHCFCSQGLVSRPLGWNVSVKVASGAHAKSPSPSVGRGRG